MKKKAFFILGVAALSVATSAATIAVMRGIDRNNADSSARRVSMADNDIFRQNPTVDVAFASSVVATDYPDLTYAAENAVKAVVNIEAIQQVEMSRRSDPFLEFFGFPQGQSEAQPYMREARAGGSGVIISEDGYIVTNNHVVDSATKLRVKLNDGREFDARVVGADPATDVALIKVEAEGLPTLPFGSSDDLRLGEWVLAIGYPMELQSTITAGIVSAKARRLGALPSQFSIESFIQTDAAVNPGNSGGALVNTRGELVGINTIIKTSTGSYVGYSFAVPETIVRKVVVDLKESGVVQRAVLGISFRAIDQSFVDQMGDQTGIDRIGGIYVATVTEDGAASEAGLRKGDVILAIDGVEVNTSSVFLEQIGKRRPGDEITLKVRRGDTTREFTAKLRNKAGRAELLSREEVDVAAALGGKFADVSSKTCRELDIRGGVQVVSIKRGGLLERARVKQGFIITHINDKPVYSAADLDRLTDKITSIDGVYPNGRASSYTIL
ncbi:MAG: trypsin-like peptidase domain-containing protein [Alistipes sp.]|nr:trypsin-like peptidase domain-containing protein [Alistipes sp.]MDE7130154.1 trypsin-like peptidase domain-containing protein [Alistipes sp.]